MALNQSKYKPTICSIDELDDINLKNDDLQKQQHIEGSETAPLTTNQQQQYNMDSDKRPITATQTIALTTKSGKEEELKKNSDDQDGNPQIAVGGFNMNGLKGRLSFDALRSLSRKRRILYISTACLCAVLLIIIIMLIVFWPEVPFYLKADICLEKECVQATQQILLWANTTKHRCHNTYEWACGNFEHDYEQNNYYVIKRGEWNFKTYNEYQELNELNRFISMFPSNGNSDSIESMITSLYHSCRDIDTLDKSQSDLLLKKAINLVDGWQAFATSKRLQNWDFKKALVYLQTIYGIFPYYKVTVDNRYNKHQEYIITLDEGEIGLPDKYFYNIDQNDEIIKAYKLLLRDFAINMGLVSRAADLFADEIFYYEKRIVNDISAAKSSAEQQSNNVKTLYELKTLANSLPILESLQALFPHTKITEDTEVLVRDVQYFQELSNVVSSSDKKVMNNFIIWSLARNLLPHLSKEYRNLIENFDHAIYGRTATYPRWMICTKIVREWLPFAVDALQQQNHLLKSIQKSQKNWNRLKHMPNNSDANDELLNLMFYTLKNQLQNSVENAHWIDNKLKQFINKKLTEMRLQIGIPEQAFDNKTYIQEYYRQLLLNNIFFVEHLESMWTFRKARMEQKLIVLDTIDTIVSEMYTRDTRRMITYSNSLNMLIISREVIISNYFNYRFPISVNFARIGTDILEVLIESILIMVEQFKAEQDFRFYNDFNLAKVDINCLTFANFDDQDDVEQFSMPALESFYITLSAARVAAKSLSTFIGAIDTSSPITGAAINPQLTYENLRLTERKRLPGFRSFNDNELFTLTYMQKHCGTTIADKDYARIKPHVEQSLAERYLFEATWSHIQFLTKSISCPARGKTCSNIL